MDLLFPCHLRAEFFESVSIFTGSFISLKRYLYITNSYKNRNSVPIHESIRQTYGVLFSEYWNIIMNYCSFYLLKFY